MILRCYGAMRSLYGDMRELYHGLSSLYHVTHPPAAASAPPPLGVTLNAVQSVAFTSPPTPSRASPSTLHPSHASPSTLHPSQPPPPGKLQVCVAGPGPGPLVVQQRLDQTSSSLEAALQAVERKLTQDDVSDG